MGVGAGVVFNDHGGNRYCADFAYIIYHKHKGNN